MAIPPYPPYQQPQPPYQTYQQPMQQPQYQPPYKPTQISFEGIFSKKVLASLIFLGIILMGIGVIIINASVNTEKPPKEDIAEWREDKYYEQRATQKAGAIIWNIGVMIMFLALFGGALTNSEIDLKLRIGMLIVAFLMLIFSNTFGQFNAGFDKWGYQPHTPSPYYP